MSGAVPTGDAGPALLAVTQSVTVFVAFLPPLSDVRKASMSDTEFVADVRLGEMASAALTVGIGATVGAMIGTGVPFAVSILSAIALVALYEYALRGKPFSVPRNPADLTSEG